MASPPLLYVLFEQTTNNSNKTNQIEPNRQTPFFVKMGETEGLRAKSEKNYVIRGRLEFISFKSKINDHYNIYIIY